MKILLEDIDILVRPIKKPSRVLATASLIVCSCIEIHGYTISKSNEIHPRFQEKIWIQPPKSGPPYWKKIAYISDKELWSKVEEQIYNEFLALKINFRNEEVNLNEIPEKF